jgi:ankyrin repeat protein
MPIIHYSILIQRLEVLHMLLSSGFNPNARCHGDWAPLHLAAHLGLFDCVEMLLFFRASVDIPDRFGATPLHVAIRGSETDIVRSLLRAGASVSKSPAALTAAVAVGNPDIVSLLVRYGADPRMPDRTGQTAFDLARGSEQSDIERALRTPRDPEQAPIKGGRIALLNPPPTTLSDLLDRLPPEPPRSRPRPFAITKL